MTTAPPLSSIPPSLRGRLDTAYRVSVIALAAIVTAAVLLSISQAALYKIRPYERGLHLRGGRFLAVDEPGWHVQIPYVDTVIIVTVNERLGYVERISAVTADNLQMVVSLQYTYRVTDPARFALEVDDPERILFELVQGKLRDVANQQSMTEMMNNRATFNSVMLDELRQREQQYGVEFVTVQLQSAEPPADVVSAIEDRMVAAQRQAQAEAEAAQQRVLADAEYYAAQKRADAEAYQITQLAAAQQESIRRLLGELSLHPAIAESYLQYLMTQELSASGSAKWVIGQPGSTQILDLRPDAAP
jgi:regulator of protease activity HflC (stomatin/prohibitin superfamily)